MQIVSHRFAINLRELFDPHISSLQSLRVQTQRLDFKSPDSKNSMKIVKLDVNGLEPVQQKRRQAWTLSPLTGKCLDGREEQPDELDEESCG